MPPSKALTLAGYRDFVLGSVKRDFQMKYANSIFGAAWSVINPIATIAVYTLVFSHLMPVKFPGVHSGLSYSFYLCAGILSWGLFVEITTRCQSMFLENSNLVKKIKFPLICLPIGIVISSLLNFLIIFSLFLGLMIFSGNFPGLVFAWILPILLLIIAFSLGLGLMLSVLNVFFRDIGHLFGLFVTFWFWLTPIVYTLSSVPAYVQSVLKLNPMTPVIISMQNIIVFKQIPDVTSLIYPLFLAVVMIWISSILIRSRFSELIDEL